MLVVKWFKDPVQSIHPSIRLTFRFEFSKLFQTLQPDKTRQDQISGGYLGDIFGIVPNGSQYHISIFGDLVYVLIALDYRDEYIRSSLSSLIKTWSFCQRCRVKGNSCEIPKLTIQSQPDNLRGYSTVKFQEKKS